MTEDMQVRAFQERLAALDQAIARLSESDTDPEQYFRLFLEQTVAVLGVGGAVWRVQGTGDSSLLCHVNLQVAGVEENGRQAAILNAALQKVLQSRSAVVLPGSAASNLYDGGLGGAGVNDSPHTLLLAPIMGGEQPEAVLLLISPEDVDPRAVRGYAGFVVGLCERGAAFLQKRRLAELEGRLLRAERLRQFISAAHSSLDPRRACYALANYGQEVLGVWRCMAGVFTLRGRFRLEAVSGIESVAVKSSFLRRAADLARQVCRNDKPLLVDNPDAARTVREGEDDLLTAARVYMLEAGARVLGVFPIRYGDGVVGALMVEKTRDEPIDAGQRQQIDGLVAEAGVALHNALEHRQMPLSALVRALGALRDGVLRLSWSRRAVGAALLTAVLLAPVLISKQVKVVGTAELTPVDARIAYAAQEGIIENVAVSDEKRQVTSGQVLAWLDTRLIDAEIDRVENTIAETGLALAQETRENARTTALATRYESALKALNAELETYKIEKQQHQILAPINGLVITRDSTLRQLARRPVARGEPVLEVVPEGTAWQLLVYVPEEDAGELLRAWRAYGELGAKRADDELGAKRADDAPRARVILYAYPELTFESHVLSVARRAHVETIGEQKYRNVIEVRVAEPADLRRRIEPRQGLKGKVAIECGRRSLWYAVTHEFVDFLRVSLF